jgi:predicted ATPase
MIETVRFKNFKALRDVTVALERFTVLVGPNASGKTSVLQGLDYLFFLRHANPDFFRGERDLQVLLSRGTAGDACFEIHGAGVSAQKSISIDLSLFENGDSSATWSIKASDGESVLDYDEGRYHNDDQRYRHRTLLDDVTPAVDMLRFDASKLAQASYSATLVPHIEPDGEGLAAVLAEMLISRPDDFRRIEQSLRAVIPSVERIRLERSPIKRSELQQITVNGHTTSSTIEREYVGHRVVFDMQGAPNLAAHGASEGTLITLGILTAIFSHEGPHLILIDDLERAIHPRAIGELVAQLRQLLARFPDLQIVATSHSPYLIDHLDPTEVRLLISDDTGSVKCARLSDHPELARWQEFMRPGEIWSMVGEEWVSARGAQPHA